MTREQLQVERDIIIRRYYRREDRQWCLDADTKELPASEEMAREFQNKISSINFKIQMIDEEEIVVKHLDGVQINPDANAKFMPLVSRRRHPELWTRINKIHFDGTKFTFDAAPKKLGSDLFCGCTDDELIKQFNLSDSTLEQLTGQKIATTKFNIIKYLRAQHTMRAQGIHNTGPVCPKPIEKDILQFQHKHTIGNWGCKGCLNLGTEIKSATDADSALANATKAIEWCPRFLTILRSLSFPDYVKAAQGNNICYAGLVHSEMHMEDVDDKHYVVIKTKCDSCSYLAEERKEYHMPEQIHANEVLVTGD